MLLALGNRGSAVRITFGGTRQGRGGEGRTGRKRAGPNREQKASEPKKRDWAGLSRCTDLIEHLRYAEVGELGHAVLGEQHILRLEVSVDNVVAVQELL